MRRRVTELKHLIQLIEQEKRFIVATHIQPDGDALGSLLGLGLWLRKIGKDVSMTWGEEIKVPSQYAFLPGINLLSQPQTVAESVGDDPRVVPSLPTEPSATFIVVDCASIERLGILQKEAKKAQNLVNIDHHPGNTKYGTINLIDEKTSSSAELVYKAIKSFAPRPSLLDHDIALCLYTGIVTDTGRFQYSNTNENTFKIALELLQYGISPNYIFQNVYENLSFASLQLLGRILDKAKVYPTAPFIYTSITQQDLQETKAIIEETENFVDYLRAVGETKVAAIFKEMPNSKIKVSMRSKNEIDVGELARKFGGGGHRNAAGFTSDKDIEGTLEVLARAWNEGRKTKGEGKAKGERS